MVFFQILSFCHSLHLLWQNRDLQREKKPPLRPIRLSYHYDGPDFDWKSKWDAKSLSFDIFLDKQREYVIECVPRIQCLFNAIINTHSQSAAALQKHLHFTCNTYYVCTADCWPACWPTTRETPSQWVCWVKLTLY